MPTSLCHDWWHPRLAQDATAPSLRLVMWYLHPHHTYEHGGGIPTSFRTAEAASSPRLRKQKRGHLPTCHDGGGGIYIARTRQVPSPLPFGMRHRHTNPC